MIFHKKKITRYIFVIDTFASMKYRNVVPGAINKEIKL